MRHGMKKALVLFLTLSMTASTFSSTAVFAATDQAVVQEEEKQTVLEPAKSTEATTETAVTKTPAAEKKSVKSDSTAKSVKSTATAKDKKKAKNAIEEGIFRDRNKTTISVEDYNLTKQDAKEVTNDVLEDSKTKSLVDVTYDTKADGTVENVNVETDAAMMMAMDELDEINETSENPKSEDQMQTVYEHYAQLQKFYEANPDFFGIAVPYFTSKDTKEGPVSALLSVADIPRAAIGVEGGITIEQVDELVQGFNQALPAMVQHFSEALEGVTKQALAQLDDKMTAAEKMLVLNDWLGNYTNFDMAEISKMQEEDKGEATAAQVDEKVEKAEEDPLAGMYKSTAVGALVKRNTVCMSYTAAYTYLVQRAFPEIYKNDDGSWKTKDEVNGTMELKKDENGDAILDADGNKQYEVKGEQTYIMDFVKIKWDSDVEMLGEKSHFAEPHYFNAAKVDGKWYYIDSCYNDIYVECMGRNRVETDGNMTHGYFLISDTSLRKQFDGNFEYIDTLYKDEATDTSYEEAWFTKAQGPISHDADNWYYVQNTSSYNFSGGSMESEQKPDQLVKRSRTETDVNAGASVLADYETGKDADGNAVEGADMLTEAYKQDKDVNAEKYSSLMHATALYNNALYLNADNKVLKYDLETKKISKVKEYNTVYATQDKDKEFKGMSFSAVPEGTEGIVHTVKDHPIAALTIKDDGKLYVSVATNFCYASDYKVEETNYNSEYMNYNFGGQQISRGGDNDNQEFMWSANFVDSIDMSHLTGSEHTYAKVKVDPTCTEKGYTEERCTTCGIAKADGEKTDETEATGHHYVKFHETYYTKDDSGNAKTGDAYVCAGCMDAQTELPEGAKAEHVYGDAKFKWSEDHKTCEASVTCTACEGKELDCVAADKTVTKTADCTVTSDKADDFNCDQGGTINYTAKATIDGKEYTDTQKVEITAGSHTYGKPVFTWSDDKASCEAKFTCDTCGTETTEKCTVTKETTDATCTQAGKTVYKAVCTFAGQEYSEGKEEEIPAKGHTYGAPVFQWAEDGTSATASYTCSACKEEQSTDCTVTSEVVKAVSCTDDGIIKYTAACKVGDKSYTDDKTVNVKAVGHQFGVPTFTWSKADDGQPICIAAFQCTVCQEEELDLCDKDQIKTETTAATCTQAGKTVYTATFEFEGKTYTDAREETIAATGHRYDANGVCSVCQTKKPGSQLRLSDKKAVYTGKAIYVNRAAVSGSKGAVSYVYYTNSACTAKTTKSNSGAYTTGGAPVNPGVYYVKATVAADADYMGTTSNVVKLQIVPKTVNITSIYNTYRTLTLKWSKVSKASGYYIYRSTNGKTFSKIATITKNSTVKYSDRRSLKNGSRYLYRVYAYYNGTARVTSYASATKTRYRLSRPYVSYLKNKSSRKIYVKWSRNSKASGYQIYYDAKGVKSKTVTVSARAKSKTITKLKKRKTYYVCVRSYKKVGNTKYYSAWSTKKKVKIYR